MEHCKHNLSVGVIGSVLHDSQPLGQILGFEEYGRVRSIRVRIINLFIFFIVRSIFQRVFVLRLIFKD